MLTLVVSLAPKVSGEAANTARSVGESTGKEIVRASQNSPGAFCSGAFSTRRTASASSGVSLDEEMTDLIKYQRAYEASAKMITTIDQMLETVVGLVR